MLQEIAERARVAGGRERGVERCLAGGAVVWVIDVSVVVVDERARILADHHVGLECAHDADDVFAELKSRLQLAVRIAQEVHAAKSKDASRFLLFGFADADQLFAWEVWILAAGIAAGEDQVMHRMTVARQSGRGAGHAEIGIVGMCRDYQVGRHPARITSGLPCSGGIKFASRPMLDMWGCHATWPLRASMTSSARSSSPTT